jgi:hypothetical protein
MKRFAVVGAKEYGTGAVIDYKSGSVKDGAAITLFVAADRNWGVGRFGIITKPSTETTDAKSRAGYRKAVDEYLAAVRKRDCDAYVSLTFNGNDQKDVVCKETFPATADLAKRLKANSDAVLTYEGGNKSFGFYSLETAKPTPSNLTISVAKATSKAPKPYIVLDVTPSPTGAQQKKAAEAFEEKQDQKPDQDMEPSSKPVDS